MSGLTVAHACTLQNKSPPQSMIKSIAAIKEQYALAARGTEQDLQSHWTQSGVKDEVTVYWQDQLLKRA